MSNPVLSDHLHQSPRNIMPVLSALFLSTIFCSRYTNALNLVPSSHTNYTLEPLTTHDSSPTRANKRPPKRRPIPNLRTLRFSSNIHNTRPRTLESSNRKHKQLSPLEPTPTPPPPSTQRISLPAPAPGVYIPALLLPRIHQRSTKQQSLAHAAPTIFSLRHPARF